LCDDSQDQVETGSDSDLLSDLVVDVDLVSEGDVQHELEDHQQIDLGNLEDCPHLKCIMDKFIEHAPENPNYLCNLMNTFKNPNNPKLSFHYDNGGPSRHMEDQDGDYRALNTRPGVTVPSVDEMKIILNRNICDEGDVWGVDYDGDGIQNPDGSETINGVLFGAAVMIHEIMHAQMNSWIANLYPNDWNPNLPHNLPPNAVLWQSAVSTNLVNPIPGTTPPQHDLMQYFIDQITASLFELNDRNGSLADYEYLARLATNSVNYDDDYSLSDLLADRINFEQNISFEFNCD